MASFSCFSSDQVWWKPLSRDLPTQFIVLLPFGFFSACPSKCPPAEFKHKTCIWKIMENPNNVKTCIEPLIHHCFPFEKRSRFFERLPFKRYQRKGNWLIERNRVGFQLIITFYAHLETERVDSLLLEPISCSFLLYVCTCVCVSSYV